MLWGSSCKRENTCTTSTSLIIAYGVCVHVVCAHVERVVLPLATRVPSTLTAVVGAEAAAGRHLRAGQHEVHAVGVQGELIGCDSRRHQLEDVVVADPVAVDGGGGPRSTIADGVDHTRVRGLSGKVQRCNAKAVGLSCGALPVLHAIE